VVGRGTIINNVCARIRQGNFGGIIETVCRVCVCVCLRWLACDERVCSCVCVSAVLVGSFQIPLNCGISVKRRVSLVALN
jgi:hypothetical protein